MLLLVRFFRLLVHQTIVKHPVWAYTSLSGYKHILEKKMVWCFCSWLLLFFFFPVSVNITDFLSWFLLCSLVLHLSKNLEQWKKPEKLLLLFVVNYNIWSDCWWRWQKGIFMESAWLQPLGHNVGTESSLSCSWMLKDSLLHLYHHYLLKLS